ncbi:hypothetical protein TIFTF001_019694 [Ficus carica]|uniref:Uncharacterized protein n=1 Tax=Ficus carica TaxID=3494 RepID=A0AA88D951_FICCA|nr:hypothetical protein TIFTF001_019694 [Ficus carica]
MERSPTTEKTLGGKYYVRGVTWSVAGHFLGSSDSRVGGPSPVVAGLGRGGPHHGGRGVGTYLVLSSTDKPNVNF